MSPLLSSSASRGSCPLPTEPLAPAPLVDPGMGMTQVVQTGPFPGLYAVPAAGQSQALSDMVPGAAYLQPFGGSHPERTKQKEEVPGSRPPKTKPAP